MNDYLDMYVKGNTMRQELDDIEAIFIEAGKQLYIYKGCFCR